MGRQVVLDTFKGNNPTLYPLGRVELDIGPVQGAHEVAVCTEMEEDALLGADLGVHACIQLLHVARGKIEKQSKIDDEQQLKPNRIRMTKGQKAREEKIQREDEQASGKSASEPTPLSDLFDFDDSVFDDSVGVAADPVPALLIQGLANSLGWRCLCPL